jgi:hypothetical protein
MNSFTTGFIKSAQTAKLNAEGLDKILKVANEANTLTPQEIASIRQALDSKENQDSYFNGLGKPYGAQLLAARDQALGVVPEFEGGMAAARSGAHGAAVGGLSGYGVGSMLRKSNILGSAVPYGFKRNLPVALGTTGAVVGALMKALPEYKSKIDQMQALRKLNDSARMHEMLGSLHIDRAVLNS